MIHNNTCSSMWKEEKHCDVVSVKTIETKDTILAIMSCRKLRGDSWANAVQGRIYTQLMLHVYHRVCSTNFRTKSKCLAAIHEQDIDTRKKVKLGRPLEKDGQKYL